MSVRTVQHRPKRENQKARELADLKRQNRKLQKELAEQAGKPLQPCCKCNDVGCENCLQPSKERSAAAEKKQRKRAKDEPALPICPKCGRFALQVAELPRGTFSKCRECDYRGFIKNE